MIFFIAVAAPCLFLSLRLRQAEYADREMHRINRAFRAACDDTAGDIIGFIDGEPVPECERAAGEFIKNLAVRLGVADDPVAREELFRYVPCVLVTCEDGVFVTRLTLDESSGEAVMVNSFADSLESVINVPEYENVIPSGQTGESGSNNVRGTAGQMTKGLYTANLSHASEGPCVIAIFTGYPVGGTKERFSGFGVSGAYFKEAEGFYITEERSGLLYHAEGSGCIEGKAALRVASRREAAEHGARACGRCFYNGVFAARDHGVAGR